MISAVIEYENKEVTINNSPVQKVGTKFEPGVYVATSTQNGVNIKKATIKESHEPFPSNVARICSENSSKFFALGIREKINNLGFLHKLGILLWGRQGTGKTSLMNYYGNQLVEQAGAVCFICNNSADLAGAIGVGQAIREIQDSPLVFLCDEFERFASNSESEMKNFLDGNDSIDNSLVIACTNYLDKVPKTISERQSRFRIVEEVVGIEQADIISSILKERSEMVSPPLFTDEEIDEHAKDLSQKGSTIDEIKNVVLSKATNCFYKSNKSSKLGFNKKGEELQDKGEGSDYLLFGDSFKIQKTDKSN